MHSQNQQVKNSGKAIRKNSGRAARTCYWQAPLLQGLPGHQVDEHGLLLFISQGTSSCSSLSGQDHPQPPILVFLAGPGTPSFCCTQGWAVAASLSYLDAEVRKLPDRAKSGNLHPNTSAPHVHLWPVSADFRLMGQPVEWAPGFISKAQTSSITPSGWAFCAC